MILTVVYNLQLVRVPRTPSHVWGKGEGCQESFDGGMRCCLMGGGLNGGDGLRKPRGLTCTGHEREGYGDGEEFHLFVYT